MRSTAGRCIEEFITSSLNKKVSAASATQYISVVLKYHINYDFASPTLNPTAKDLLQAFANKEEQTDPRPFGPGWMGADVMKRVLEFSLITSDTENVGACAAVVFSFNFHCCTVAVVHVAPLDASVTPKGVTGHLKH